MLTQKGQSSGDGSTYTVQSADQEEPESDEEHSPWRSLSSTASSGGKKKVNEDDKKLPKVNFRWPEPKWSSRGQLEVRGSAGPYKLAPTEAENHQLSPSFIMLALFFILQVNYQLTCSLISPSKQNEGFLLKNMIKLIFLSV